MAKIQFAPFYELVISVAEAMSCIILIQAILSMKKKTKYTFILANQNENIK
jgi:hypothetical protein